MSNMVLVEVMSVYMDRNSQSPVLLLKERDGKRVLPIWIGFFEAQSIMFVLRGVMLQRPLTHDLCSDTICILGGKLTEVQIHDLVNGTFYARMMIDQDGKQIKIDSRPSDSVAIALRQSCPIYVSDKIMAEAGMPDFNRLEAEHLEDILSKLPDEAFGKYNM